MEHETKTNGKTDNQKSVPVYLSFKTFQAAIDNLRTHGLPGVLDRTAFGTRSGGEQTQILSAFKFLGLMDDQARTQEPLRALRKAAANSAEEKQVLASILKDRYANAFALDLEAATPQQLDKAIADLGASGTTKGRSIRFFLKAAEHAGIKVSSRLTARKPRSSSGSSDSSQSAKSTKAKKPDAPPPLQTAVSNGAQIMTVQLPNGGGTLTLSGTINIWELVGDERDLVFGITDMIRNFKNKNAKGTTS
jgi:hypothetical protein